ncbi:MAG: hypothetical protein AB1896_06660 [Thermodesulfobacteriota bacterium]
MNMETKKTSLPAPPPEDSCAVMFSGGLDSTVAAIQMARRFRRLVLVTADFPYTINLRASTRNLARLQAAFPKTSIEQRLVNASPLRRRVWAGFCRDYFTFCQGRGLGLTCLGCKISMMLAAIKVCLRERLGHLSNGMTRSQSGHPDCLPEMVNRFGEFMAEYNIVYINEVYDIRTRGEENRLLEQYGLGQGLRIGASSVTHQPRCFVGPYTKLWLAAAPVDKKHMLAYFDSRRPVMRSLLAPDEVLKSGLRGRWELRTVVDESRAGRHTHEFSPIIDRALGLSLSPLWWASKIVLALHADAGHGLEPRPNRRKTRDQLG